MVQRDVREEITRCMISEKS